MNVAKATYEITGLKSIEIRYLTNGIVTNRSRALRVNSRDENDNATS